MLEQEKRVNNWLKQNFNKKNLEMTTLAGDASFRRYYRLHYETQTAIFMDASSSDESIKPFLDLQKLLREQGLKVPEIVLADESAGFAILEDFGDSLLLNELHKDNAETLYELAIEALITLQSTPTSTVPVFDKAFIRAELNLFTEWFLSSYLKLTLNQAEKRIIETTFDYLCNEIDSYPKVFIHRDYHSRNLMLVPDKQAMRLGLLDFQDAMLGPFAYDLTSLLKDCYIQWPRQQILQHVKAFYRKSPLARSVTESAFIKAFDLCGLQRHLKVLGIFSRLYIRDSKSGYLQNLPLTLHYVLSYLEEDEKLRPFYEFLQQRVSLP